MGVPASPAATATVSASGAASFSGLTPGQGYYVVGWWPVTGVAGTNVLTAVGVSSGPFPLKNGDPVKFRALTGGTGLTAGTQYFARDVSGDTFKVATTPGGAEVDFTIDVTAGRLDAPTPPRIIRAYAEV